MFSFYCEKVHTLSCNETRAIAENAFNHNYFGFGGNTESEYHE